MDLVVIVTHLGSSQKVNPLWEAGALEILFQCRKLAKPPQLRILSWNQNSVPVQQLPWKNVYGRCAAQIHGVSNVLTKRLGPAFVE